MAGYGDTSVDMMLNVLPGTFTGIFALNAGLSSINQTFQNMTKGIDNHFGLLDAALVSATALAVQFGKGAADAFGEYEQGMKIVQAVSGQSSAAIAELGQKANEFSVQYRMDIADLTEGLQTLGRAGLKSASEQTEVLESGLQTAKLEGRDLNSVLEELIQNTTLLGGDLKSSNFGEQSEYVNDLLVATSMTAPINTHDVSETLKYSGGIAAAAGANIESSEGKEILEDYMGTIAAFAQKGVKGSIAGTALRAFFNKPATQDSSVLEGLRMIGLKPEYLWEDDQETMKPVSEQISLIQSQMDKKGISQMDRLQIWSKIVGGKMGQQMMKLEGSDIREITTDIKEANSAENLATQSMQTYQAAMKQAGEAGQLAFREFGEHVARFLTPVAKIITPILEALSNPIVSTVAFTAFLKLISLAWNSIKKIFAGVRAELGILKAEFKSMVLNQDTRKGLMGGHLWGKGSISSDYRKMFTQSSNDVQLISNKVKETSSISNTSSNEVLQKINQIYLKVNNIRDVLVAVNNKIKETLIEINSKIEGTLSTTRGVFIKNIGDIKKTVDGSIASSGQKAQAELTSGFTKSVSVLRNELNATINSTMTKFRTMSSFSGVGTTSKGQFLAKNYPFAVSNTGLNHIGPAIPINGTYASVGGRSGDLRRIQMSYQAQADILEKNLAQIQSRQQFHTTMSFMEKKITAEKEAIAELEGQIHTLMVKAQKQTGTQAKLMQDQMILLRAEINTRKAQVAMIERHLAETKALYAEELAAIRFRINSTKRSVNPGVSQNGIPVNYSSGSQTTNITTTRTVIPTTKNSSTSNRNATNLLNNQIAWSQEDKAAREAILKERLKNQRLLAQENVAKQETIRLEEAYNVALGQALATMEKNVLGKTSITPFTFGHYNRYNLPDMTGVTPRTAPFIAPGGAHNAAMAAYASMYPRFFHEGENVALSLSGKETPIPMNETVQKINKTLIDFDRAVAKTTAKIDSKRAGHVTTQGSRTIIGSGFNEESYARAQAKQEAANLERSLKESENRINSMTGKNIRTITMNPVYSVGPDPAAKDLMEQNKNLMKEAGMTAEQQRAANALFATSSTTDKIKGRWDKLAGLEKNSSALSKRFSGLSKVGRGLGNAFSKTINFMGGPFFAGLMAVDIAMQIYTSLHNEYIKKVEEATQKIEEMTQAVSDAENVFFNGRDEEGLPKITGWSEEHPDATAEEKEDALLGAYSEIYDHSKEGLSSLDANTQQLAIATEELKRANDSIVSNYMNDPNFGPKGAISRMMTELNNPRQGIQDMMDTGKGSIKLEALGMALDTFNRLTSNVVYNDKFGDISHLKGDSLLDSGEIQLDDWQKSEEYPWSQEFSPIIASEIWRTGSTAEGLKVSLGEKSISALKDQYSSLGTEKKLTGVHGEGGFVDPWETSAWNVHGRNMENYFSSNEDQNKLQMGLKNFSKDFSKLAKQTRRFEKATGRTALGSLQNEMKKNKNMKTALKNLQVTDPKLVNYIKSLAIKTGMDEQQVLMAAQLQQLQDMQEIANTQITPRMESVVGLAYQQVAYGGQTLGEVGSSGAGAVSAAQNAAAIAALLNAKMETALDEKGYKQWVKEHPNEEDPYGDAVHWAAARDAAHDDGVTTEMDKYYDDWAKSYAAVNAMMYNPDLSTEDAEKMGAAWYEGVKGASSSAMYDTLRKGGIGALKNNILDAYDADLDAVDGGGSGGGGSGGSGKSDNNNTGTRRERVDLVLCNKKEIPKLNVNLFKKPPSFTILNKNFKLRDVKINSEDKPKAIMAAIKNSFIDIQKRTDPKIIQDEDAVYDPAAATDGTNVPSGTAKTKTDNN